MIAFGEDACRLVHRRGVPAVLLGRDGTQDGIESLFADDEQGGYMATKHLIERGHRRIIYLGAAKGLDVSERRAGGYRRALEEAGIEPDESLIVQYREFDRTLQKNMDLFMEYLYGSGATAVFAFNDNFAYRIMRRLDAIGKNVPQDFAVVGYDNLQDYLKLPLWLTTVGVDFLRMANAATDYVLAKIKGRRRTSCTVLFTAGALSRARTLYLSRCVLLYTMYDFRALRKMPGFLRIGKRLPYVCNRF